MVSNTFFIHSLQSTSLCLLLAALYTLFLEGWQYLLIDIIPYAKWVTFGILIISIGLYIYGISNYMLFSLLYLDIVMLHSLYKGYTMFKALAIFKQKESL